MSDNQRDNIIRQKMLGLPVIPNLDEFSSLTRVSKSTIFKFSNFSDRYYKTYTIPKKDGSDRLISQPSKKLKGLQVWILTNILNKLNVSEYCKGFEKNTSISDNARPHIGAHTILTVDLEDFFHNVKREYVFSIFRSAGYNNNISTLFTNICTYNNCLPQGGPCSSKLANLALWNLDVRIQGYVGRRGINYTRYADDMTFSGNNPKKVTSILPTISKIVNDESFQINKEKTRVSGPTVARKVTGLIINDESFGIGKAKYKIVRAKIHSLIRLKRDEGLKQLNEVAGWLSYISSVDKPRYNKSIRYIKMLSKKYPDTLVNLLIDSID